MKKLLIALACAGMFTGANAQEATPQKKYSVATNSFWSNWFVQLGGDYHAWYPDEEHGRFDKRAGVFSEDRRTFGAHVAIGKWFTPGLGLRTKLQAWQGKKIAPKSTGERETFDMWILNEHIMFNMSNLLCGYNPNRVWNVILFAGGGVARNMSDNLYAMQLSAGIQSTWRLGKRANFYVEAGWNRLEEDFSLYQGTSLADTRLNRGWEDKDNDVYAEVGLTFNLGTATWDKVPDVDAIKALSQSQIDALNAQLNDANAENARLKNLLANQPKQEAPKAVKEFVTTPVSVFFNINRTNIASQKDLVNVAAIAKYAKENGNKLLVNGYADSATGTPDINQRLSEGRAATVADELVKMGVDRSNITTVGRGGVDELSPISFNRRATVQVSE